MTPLSCQHCQWVGFNHAHCPDCSGPVQIVGQKRLDQLRVRHKLLSKGSYEKGANWEQRERWRVQIEALFSGLEINLA